jgi:hypothetical protein
MIGIAAASDKYQANRDGQDDHQEPLHVGVDVRSADLVALASTRPNVSSVSRVCLPKK